MHPTHDCKLFIDTMVYLHFRPLDELDLRSLTGASTVTLVVPRITLRELDKHKATHSARKVRERARRILNDLAQAIEASKPLKGDINVELASDYPKSQIETLRLNEAWSDDVLLASIIAYREESHASSVALITQDTGLRLHCHQYGITTLRLSEELRLPEDVDDAAREIRELKLENQRLRTAMPKLHATCGISPDSPSVARFSLSPHPPVDEAGIQSALSELQNTYPKRSIPGTLPPTYPHAAYFNRVIQSMARMSLDGISQERIDRYNSDLDAFYAETASHLRTLHELREPLSRTISLSITVHNTGTAPADDVDVAFHFPSGICLFSDENFPTFPPRPEPPDPPMSHIDEIQRSDSLASMIPVPRPKFPRFPVDSSFKIIAASDGMTATDHFNRIKHGSSVTLPTMYVEFASLADAHSFNCTYDLRPANLADTIRVELHFVVDRQSL